MVKNGFQPLQELVAAASQESPRNLARLRGSQLVSRISYLGYRPTHTRGGNSRQCQLGGNLVPRPIVLPGLQHVGVKELADPVPTLAKLHKLCFQYRCSRAFFALLR